MDQVPHRRHVEEVRCQSTRCHGLRAGPATRCAASDQMRGSDHRLCVQMQTLSCMKSPNRAATGMGHVQQAGRYALLMMLLVPLSTSWGLEN